MEWIRRSGAGVQEDVCDAWELLTVISSVHAEAWPLVFSLLTPIHVGQRSNCAPLIWEVRNFLLDDFSNSDLELELLRHVASSNSIQIAAKAVVPRILARSKASLLQTM